MYAAYTLYEMESARRIWINLESFDLCLPFQRYNWAHTWVKHHNNIKPCIIVVTHNNVAIMILPLCIVSKGVLRVVEFIGGEFNDYNAPVLSEYVTKLDNQEFERLYKCIGDKLPPHDYLNLFRMPPVVNGISNPMAYLPQTVREGSVGHRVLLRDRKTLAKSAYKEVAKKTRKFMANSIRFEDGFDLDAFNTLVGWKRRQFPKSLPESQVAFYLALVEDKDTRLYRMYIDDELVAAQFAMVSGKTCTGLIIGYDPKWSSISPGKMLTMYMLDDLHMDGFELFDSGQGAEKYKSDYGNGWYSLYAHQEAKTVFGVLYQAARRVYASMRKATAK